MLWSDKVLTGKRVLISGASSGIGRACAVVCSSLGAWIVAMGRNEERLAETMALLQGFGHQSLLCDIGNSDELQVGFASLTVDGPYTGFIHSAGLERTNPLKTIDVDEFTEMFRINVAAGIEISRLISRPGSYDKNGTCHIFISSVSGVFGEKGKIEYSSTKAALIGAVKAMARELGPKGIRVNCVSPGMVETPMLQNMFSSLPEASVKTIETRHLMGIPKPEDIADLCVFLLSDLGKRITGENIIIDSGYSLA